jgi:NADPH:quinone reductase-like Zn-dependent oxidoreductase
MKAAVYSKSEPSGFQIREVEKPVPKDNEVLIRVRAASLNPLDSHLLRHPFMRRILFATLTKLKSTGPGRDVAGEVEAVGSKVTRFKPGDAVFGSCSGAFAEYVCASESVLAIKPESVTFEQAASAPIAGLTALQALRDAGHTQPGQKVLINGAAGGVGTFAVQVAKSLGAEVTGVCSTRNVEMVRSIGADRVVDYTQEDVTQSGQHFDLMFDVVANHSFSARRRILNPQGIYIGAGMVGRRPSMMGLLVGQIAEFARSRFVSQRFVSFMAKLNQEDLTILGQLIQTGKVTPVIDRRYPLSEVPEAIRYLEEKHARGKVVITLGR